MSAELITDPAQAKYRGFEAEPRPGRGFVEKRGHYEAVGQIEIFAALQAFRASVGEHEDAFDVGDSQILDRDHVAFG